MTSPRDSLASFLAVDELARVDALVADTPKNSTFGSWLPERGAVVVGAKLDGALAGWLLVPAVDEFEAQLLAETIAEGLARTYGPMREARRAAAALIRKVGH